MKRDFFLTFHASLPITPTGSISYVWKVEDLSVGEWGVITIAGRLSGTLPGGHVFTNTAAIATTAVDSDDEDVAGQQEDKLKLEYWNGESWEDAACGDYAYHAYHPDENWMAVPICHLTPFALLGSSLVPVGGVTVLASSWPWLVLAALVATGASAAVALKRRAA